MRKPALCSRAAASAATSSPPTPSGATTGALGPTTGASSPEVTAMGATSLAGTTVEVMGATERDWGACTDLAITETTSRGTTGAMRRVTMTTHRGMKWEG